jgi:isopenicillin N synthase-like dioxygenase
MIATYATCHIGGVATVPTIDIAPLLDPDAAPAALEQVAASIADACSRFGFLQLVGHGVDPALRARLHDAAAEFFALPDEEKAAVSMDRGGRAWRGWFPLGEELTSGVPDDKEGLYVGTELGPDDPRVRAGLPLHGPNLFPERPPELGPTVLAWMDAVTRVGRAVLSGIAISFGLDRDWFDRWCADPTVLFRIFHYPPPAPEFIGRWGVAEHTDYGLLTLLVQDDTGGLEVRVGDEWVQVPPRDDAIVCNLGDMLERVTGGRFRSTPHRVRLPERDRYSFPLFLDPAWDAELHPLPGCEPTERALAEAAEGRWDGASVLEVGGPYGDYLLSKVSKVFPERFERIVTTPG